MNKIYLKLVLVFLCLNLSPAHGQGIKFGLEMPRRVVSLDMCADQYVLGLAARPQIAALSPRAMAPESYFRLRARGIKQVRAEAEAILSLHPDLVIRQWGGDARLLDRLEKNHIATVQLQNLDRIEQAKPELMRIGKALGQPYAMQGEVNRLNMALKTLPLIGNSKHFLYYTPSGFSTGTGSFLGSAFSAMTFKVIGNEKGYYYIDPEHFMQIKADTFGLGFFDIKTMEARGVGRTLGVREILKKHEVLNLPPQALSCADWTSVISLSELRQPS